MVKQILSFARGASGEHGVTDLKHIIKDMTRLAKDTFPRSIRVEQCLADNLWRVNGNPTQLHQVLLNLCVNARDAMSGGGVLTIATDNVHLKGAISRWKNEPVSGPYVRLSVTDTGHGINAEVMEKLFDPFFTTKDYGTGLGLSVVHGIIQEHGGQIEVESELRKGTAFHILLPLVRFAQEVAAA
jgi:signal transduction histidine kinase